MNALTEENVFLLLSKYMVKFIKIFFIKLYNFLFIRDTNNYTNILRVIWTMKCLVKEVCKIENISH